MTFEYRATFTDTATGAVMRRETYRVGGDTLQDRVRAVQVRGARTKDELARGGRAVRWTFVVSG